MASTRNKNTPGNYCQDQRQYKDTSTWLLYENGARGTAYDTKLPGTGLNPGQMPWTTLSNNSADIESFLLGINSTNLVNPASPLVPELKCLDSAHLFKKPDIYVPEPLRVKKDQRPNPLS
jgi:hypothetical protein